MKKRIYLIVKNPFQESDITRFNTDLLSEYFDLSILDCTEWLLPDSLKTRTQIHLDLVNLIRIKSASEFKAALGGKGGYALDFIGLFSFNAIRVFNILKKNGTQIVVVDSGPFPTLGPTKSTQSLIQKMKVIIRNKLFHRFLYARLLKLYENIVEDMTPDIAMVSGTSWKNNPRFSNAKNLIFAHSFDYETYLKVDLIKRTVDKPYAVYLDENIGFHEDNKEMNLCVPVNGNNFLFKMESFFKEFEKSTGLSVKIAAYPSTDYTLYKNIFTDREVMKHNTAELIKDSQIVFAHASTAVSFAILWQKPILFILDDMMKSSWYFADIESVASAVKCPIINLDVDDDRNYTYSKLELTNFENFASYKDTYIKSKNSGDFANWTTLYKYIQGISDEGVFIS